MGFARSFNPLAWLALLVMMVVGVLALCTSAHAGCGGALQLSGGCQVQQFVQPLYVAPIVQGDYVLQQQLRQQAKLQQQLKQQAKLQQQLKHQASLRQQLTDRRDDRQSFRQRTVVRNR